MNYKLGEKKMGKIKKIIRLAGESVDMFKYNRIARKLKDEDKYKDMWLISERGVEAKDNGYVFFKYLRENHPEINAYYVIDSSHKVDYDRVKTLGNTIEYGSDEHKIAFLLCKYAISSHIGFLEPWSYKLYKLLLDRKDKKYYVFLQHGVIFNDVSNAVNSKCRIDMFVTTTEKEYKSICGDNYGFKDGVVKKTGIARYDRLNDFKTKRQILLMPTWRSDIIVPSYSGGQINDSFRETEYFKCFNGVINNKDILKLLDEYDMELIYYPHYEMQPYNHLYDVNSERVKIADRDEYDVQTLLKESMLMITDFSSVFFDFAYMKKPVIYYQKVPDHKYNKGYLDFESEGFGEVVYDEDSLSKVLKYYFDNEFVIKDEYKERIESSFIFRDSKNSERIYNEILKLKK